MSQRMVYKPRPPCNWTKDSKFTKRDLRKAGKGWWIRAAMKSWTYNNSGYAITVDIRQQWVCDSSDSVTTARVRQRENCDSNLAAKIKSFNSTYSQTLGETTFAPLAREVAAPQLRNSSPTHLGMTMYVWKRFWISSSLYLTTGYADVPYGGEAVVSPRLDNDMMLNSVNE